MWVIQHDDDPVDGFVIPCRWCVDGYGRYVNGAWIYSDEAGDRIRRMELEVASPEFADLKARAARMSKGRADG